MQWMPCRAGHGSGQLHLSKNISLENPKKSPLVIQTTSWPLHFLAVFSPPHFLLQSLLQSISLSLSLRLAFTPFCREGHQASGDPVPQEESKRPPTSYCFCITYYLCLTDLLQTNGCHMEKERQRRKKESKKTLSASSFSLWPASFSFGILTFRSVSSLAAFIFPVGYLVSCLTNGRTYVWAACCLIEPMEISILSHCKKIYSVCGL